MLGGLTAALTVLTLLLAPAVAARGEGLLEAPEPAGAHALTGIRLVPAPGKVIENATLVLRDGVVEAAGAGVEIPPDARVWERSGKTVYPGLIEIYLARPWPQGLRPEEAGHPDPRVHPERHLGDHDLLPELVTALRQAGFTAALAVPAEGVFRGQSALLSLGEGGVRSNLLLPRVAQHLGMEPRGRREEGYGISAMGVAHLLRQTFLDARWYAAARAAWQDQGGPRPVYDASLEALTPAATGAQPVVFEAKEVLELLRAGRLAAEFGLDAWIVGTGHESELLSQVRAFDLPLLLPLDFPEAPKAKKGDDLSISLEELRHWEAAPNGPLALLQAGVTLAFTSHRLDVPGDLHVRLHKALQRGLTEEQALAALTTVPARLLGAEKLLGTLEPGKIASFVVVDGSLFNGDPQITEVWVDGRRHESPGAAPAEADARGEWRLRLFVDEGTGETVRLVLEGEADDLRGEVRTKEASVPLLSARVSGTTLEVVYSGDAVGFEGAVTLELELRGDDARGLGRGPEGEFAVQGRRVEGAPPDESTPDDEAAEPQGAGR